jgi:hypothetical protein
MTETKSIFTPAAVMAAAPDAIRQAIGQQVDCPHPLADGLTLRQIAYAAGALVRPPSENELDLSIMGRGMQSSEFSAVLADGYTKITRASYDSHAADHLSFSAVMEVSDFKPVEMVSLDDDGLELDKLAENGRVTRGFAFMASVHQSVRLTTYAKAVLVSRNAIINDQASAIAQSFAAVGVSAGRIESRLVTAALENPPLLSDGLPVFGPEYANVVEQPLSLVGALATAMTALRTQPTATGQRAGLSAAHIVTSPELESDARRLIRDGGLDLQVSVLADLPAYRWYLLADSVACPAVAVLRLYGARNPIRVEQRRTPIEMDGTLVQVTADLGACILRRTGIVRGGIAA